MAKAKTVKPKLTKYKKVKANLGVKLPKMPKIKRKFSVKISK